MVVHLRVAHARRDSTWRLNQGGRDPALVRRKEILKKPLQTMMVMRKAQTARRTIVKGRTKATKAEDLPPREVRVPKHPGQNRREKARQRDQEEALGGASVKAFPSSGFFPYSFFSFPRYLGEHEGGVFCIFWISLSQLRRIRCLPMRSNRNHYYSNLLQCSNLQAAHFNQKSTRLKVNAPSILINTFEYV